MVALESHSSRSWLALAAFLLLVPGVGTLIGFLTAPGEWYAALEKPAFNPPDWVFAPVWTLLYVLVAIAGWRTWRRGHSTAMRLWWTQLLLNFAWSPAFFWLHSISGALVVVALLLVFIVLFIGASWKDDDRASALLFLPYALWVAFATLLNASIMRLN